MERRPQLAWALAIGMALSCSRPGSVVTPGPAELAPAGGPATESAPGNDRRDRVARALESGQYSDAENAAALGVDEATRRAGKDDAATGEAEVDLGRVLEARGTYDRAETVLRHACSVLPAGEPLAAAREALGCVEARLGKYEDAEKHITGSVELREQGSRAALAHALASLARLERTLGRYEAGISHAERALSLARLEQKGDDDLDTARAELVLAELETSKGRFSEALPRFEASLRAREKRLGAEHPDVAEVLVARSLLDYFQGRFEDSRKLLLRAVDVRRKALGDAHQDTFDARVNLAHVDNALGLYDDAEAIAHELEGQVTTLYPGPHLRRASYLLTLAACDDAHGRYGSEESRLRQAVEMLEATVGTKHPTYASALNNLATLELVLGRNQDARAHVDQAWPIVEAAYTPWHPTYASVLTSRASLARATGDAASAERLAKQALDLLEGQGESPWVATHANVVGQLYGSLGRPAEARTLLERALRIAEKTLGPDHLNTAVIRSNLSAVYQGLDMTGEAGEQIDRARAALDRRQGATHIAMGYVLSNLAAVSLRRGEAQAAEELLRRSIALKQSIAGEKSPLIARDLAMLSVLTANKRNDQEAIALAKQAVTVTEEALGPDHFTLVELYLNLARIESVSDPIAGMTSEDSAAVKSAERIAGKIGDDRSMRASILDTRAYLAEQRGDTSEAARLREGAKALRSAIGGGDRS